ncbi:shikimate dehydrogenase [Calditrichota bacterium]
MKKFLLIGHPLEHSYSPQIHTIAYKSNNIEATYALREINPKNFYAEILSLKKEKIDGFNVTIPYKSKIIPYLDQIDAQAKIVGAVNTVEVINGKWHGFNTDIAGFLTPLKDLANDIQHCLVLGNGGAARAVVFAILNQIKPEKMIIAGRNIQRVKNLKNELCKSMNFQNMEAFSLIDISEKISNLDLIINTTSLGMSPKINESPLPDDFALKPGAIIYDLIYNPDQTKLLKDAKKNQKECYVINGKKMLVAQAVEAIKIWTGKKISIENILSRINI